MKLFSFEDLNDLQRLMREKAFVLANLRMHDGISANAVWPEGNVVGVHLLMTLLRRELENDGLQPSDWLAGGPLNESHYIFFLDEGSLTLAGNIVAAVLAKNCGGVGFLVEIVQPGGKASVVVEECGNFGDLGSRFLAMSQAQEKNARLVKEAMARAEENLQALAERNEKRAKELEELRRRLDRMEGEQNGGEEWKKGE